MEPELDWEMPSGLLDINTDLLISDDELARHKPFLTIEISLTEIAPSLQIDL